MERLVTLGKIFSDRNRIQILLLLRREEELCVCELCDTLSLSQPLVSRHIKQMKSAGLLESTKQGKWVHYKLQKNELVETLLSSVSDTSLILPSLIKCTKVGSLR